MKILFITRKYPPAVGGMETFSAGFVKALGSDVLLLALKSKSQTNLIWWLPYALIKALWLARTVEIIHLGDGVLAGLGVVLHWLTGKPVSVTIHGLDITYRKFSYSKYIHWALPKLQGFIAVSDATQLVLKDDFQLTATVILNGININDWKLQTTHSHHLLFVGRLVSRKGCRWFVEQVMPKLPSNIELDIVGEGEEYQYLKADQRIHLHRTVNRQQLEQFYTTSLALVMPNIKVNNDMEGLGMVALEAGACGLPVLAADMEGMRSAIIDGNTGFLVKSGNVAAWLDAIQRLTTTPFSADKIRQSVQERFSWQTIAEQYQQAFKQLLHK